MEESIFYKEISIPEFGTTFAKFVEKGFWIVNVTVAEKETDVLNVKIEYKVEIGD